MAFLNYAGLKEFFELLTGAFVRADKAQSFSNTQKSQARKNLGISSSGIQVLADVSESRSADIEADTPVEVTEYEMGVNALQVFVDGVLLTPGVDFVEVSETSIMFTGTVPADAAVVIYTRS